MLFYKALFEEDIIAGFIPGTVTTDFHEAYKWWCRYSSVKRKKFGVKRCGTPVIIRFDFDDKGLLPADEFQRVGIKEHARRNCWTGTIKTKAQINTPITPEIISTDDITRLL